MMARNWFEAYLIQKAIVCISFPLIILVWLIFDLYIILGLIPSIIFQILMFAVPYYLIIRYYNNKRRKEKGEIKKIEDNIVWKYWKKKIK